MLNNYSQFFFPANKSFTSDGFTYLLHHRTLFCMVQIYVLRLQYIILYDTCICILSCSILSIANKFLNIICIQYGYVNVTTHDIIMD